METGLCHLVQGWAVTGGGLIGVGGLLCEVGSYWVMWGGLLGEMGVGSYVRWALTQGGVLMGYVEWPLM